MVYARCAKPATNLFDGPPNDHASGCSLETYDIASGRVTVLPITPPQGDVIYHPVLSGDRVAFAYVRPGEHRPRLATAALHANGPTTEIARGALRFCAARRSELSFAVGGR